MWAEIAVVVVAFAALGWYYGPGNTVCVAPEGGGACLTVHRAHGGRAEAAAALRRVREVMFVTAAFLREKYAPRDGPRAPSAEVLWDAVKPWALTAPSLRALSRPRLARALAAVPAEPTRGALAALVRKLLLRWEPANLAEGSPLNWENETAYTVQHGREMVYCLRDKKPPHAILPDSLLFFVALHEMTHIFTPGFQHPPCFWEHFRWVLHEAREAGIYAAPDYREFPQNYCGLHVDHSPLTDGVTASIWLLPPDRWAEC
jgi:hypothetical protein